MFNTEKCCKTQALVDIVISFGCMLVAPVKKFLFTFTQHILWSFLLFEPLE